MGTWDAVGGALRWMWLGRRARQASQSRGWEQGQSMVEYALILVLVTLVVISVLVLFGSQISSEFQNIANNL